MDSCGWIVVGSFINLVDPPTFHMDDPLENIITLSEFWLEYIAHLFPAIGTIWYFCQPIGKIGK